MGCATTQGPRFIHHNKTEPYLSGFDQQEIKSLDQRIIRVKKQIQMLNIKLQSFALQQKSGFQTKYCFQEVTNEVILKKAELQNLLRQRRLIYEGHSRQNLKNHIDRVTEIEELRSQPAVIDEREIESWRKRGQNLQRIDRQLHLNMKNKEIEKMKEQVMIEANKIQFGRQKMEGELSARKNNEKYAKPKINNFSRPPQNPQQIPKEADIDAWNQQHSAYQQGYGYDYPSLQSNANKNQEKAKISFRQRLDVMKSQFPENKNNYFGNIQDGQRISQPRDSQFRGSYFQNNSNTETRTPQ